MMPSFFIAHGSPLLAIEENGYTHFLGSLATALPRPKAIVLFSAHWLSAIQTVSEVSQYETIHDFGGFPSTLNEIAYPAFGDRQIARQIEDLLALHQIPFAAETERGLDHGAWVILRLLYPNADIPVVSMSVNPHLGPEEQYQIGKALAALRKNDVLLIGSGGTVHNLRTIQWQENQVVEWAREFDQWLYQHLTKWDLASLFAYDRLAPHADQAVPKNGSEHFIPIFYVLGSADEEKKATLLHNSYRYGSLSHSVWQFG